MHNATKQNAKFTASIQNVPHPAPIVRPALDPARRKVLIMLFADKSRFPLL